MRKNNMPYDISIEASFENFIQDHGKKFSQADAKILRELPRDFRYKLIEAIQDDNSRCITCSHGDCDDCDIAREKSNINNILKPKDCGHCAFSEHYQKMDGQVDYCILANNKLFYLTTIHDDCPLKKIVEKINK